MKVLQCATDGACTNNPGPAGYAYIIEDVYIEYGGLGFSTNNHAELMAVFRCLKESTLIIKYLNNKTKEDHIANIKVDSSYVFNGITQWMVGWSKRNWTTSTGEDLVNWELWRDIYEIYDPKIHQLEKVKGHSDDYLNNSCDEYAVLAKDLNLGEVKSILLYKNE